MRGVEAVQLEFVHFLMQKQRVLQRMLSLFVRRSSAIIKAGTTLFLFSTNVAHALSQGGRLEPQFCNYEALPFFSSKDYTSTSFSNIYDYLVPTKDKNVDNDSDGSIPLDTTMS